MQTFLPFADFKKSAQSLDRQRLGKQRVEGLQLLQGLTGRLTIFKDGKWLVRGDAKSVGWKNHPASKMWRGFEPALAAYTLDICDEWVERGYNDEIEFRVYSLTMDCFENPPKESGFETFRGPEIKHSITWMKSVPLPGWFGDVDFHRSHRSNLIRKLPSHYRNDLGWTDPDNLPYIWPEP